MAVSDALFSASISKTAAFRGKHKFPVAGAERSFFSSLASSQGRRRCLRQVNRGAVSAISPAADEFLPTVVVGFTRIPAVPHSRFRNSGEFHYGKSYFFLY